MLYNTTSVKRVIAKVFSDHQLQEGDHSISDMVEWASEALEKIGAFPSFTNKVAGMDGHPLIIIENFQAQLPGDFHRMIQANFSTNINGPFYPMRYATGSFDYGSELNTVTDSGDDVILPESALITLAMSLYDESYADALTRLNTYPAVRSQLNALLANTTTPTSTSGGTDFTSDFTYLITSGYIKTNVQTGYVLLAYQAIPTDGEGYPLVPDDQSFIEALYWYITMKLLYPRWKEGQVRDAVYYDARRSWNYFCKQAYGNALMPNKDQMESIKNSWLRLVPEIMEHDTSFSTLGQRQLIHNNN